MATPPGTGGRKPWLRALARVLLGLAVLYLMLRWFEHSQVYHPTREMAGSPAELARAWEDVWFKTADGVGLNGWFFPADTNSPRRELVFLVCHGNGGNISHRLGLCRALLRPGVAVFLLDYRGYGGSHGRPSEEGTYLDAQAAHSWLRHRGYSGKHIIAFGESLGGAVATELAVREEVGGLVLQSTFTSVPDIGAELFPWLPVRWLGRIRYDTHSKLPRLRVPVLVMHSRSDSLIPVHHADANLAAANEPKLFCELRGDHNDAVYEERGFADALERLLSRTAGQPARMPEH